MLVVRYIYMVNEKSGQSAAFFLVEYIAIQSSLYVNIIKHTCSIFVA